MKKFKSLTAILVFSCALYPSFASAQILSKQNKDKLLKLFDRCRVYEDKSEQCKAFRNGMRYVRLIENPQFIPFRSPIVIQSTPPARQEKYLCVVLPQNCDEAGAVVTFSPPGPNVYNTQPAWYYDTVLKALSSEKDTTKKQDLLRSFFKKRPDGSTLSNSQWKNFLSGIDGTVKDFDAQALVGNLQKFDQGVSLDVPNYRNSTPAPSVGYTGIDVLTGPTGTNGWQKFYAPQPVQ